MSLEYLKTHIVEVNEDILKICERLGRNPDDVTFIGVTKTYEPEIINASIEYGITDIAENRVQEITRKFDDIVYKVRWHLIGHLQTNKVKYIIDKVDLIHSVDSVKLAKEIQSRASKIEKIQDILIQVNVANEIQKYGIPKTDLPEVLEAISKMPNIRVCGLMNIAPFVDDPELLRNDFREMKKLFDSLSSYSYSNVKPIHLSMGMSGDYEIALEEGSNMIRIGTKIYGERMATKI